MQGVWIFQQNSVAERDAVAGGLKRDPDLQVPVNINACSPVFARPVCVIHAGMRWSDPGLTHPMKDDRIAILKLYRQSVEAERV